MWCSHSKVRLVGRLELGVMEGAVFDADHRIGAMVGDTRLFGGQMLDDFAAEEKAADDAVPFVVALTNYRTVGID